jgi:four helix bundle protein
VSSQSGSESFTDLTVQQKANRFELYVYKLSSIFSMEETYGLTSQFRRAAVSIFVNIPEGFVKKEKSVKLRFYNNI